MAEQYWKAPWCISDGKVNDNVNENYYYDRSIIGETLAAKQAVRGPTRIKGLRNNQEKTKG
ncbi:hypothetical protein CIW69_08550 [Enterobacter cloacae]|nr:hypothetical protein CIW69_08550 [Enterobacter cloacae]